MNINKIQFLFFLIIQTFLLSPILCAADTISMRKRGCLFMDKLTDKAEIVSFDYNEGYYRAIHSNYGYWVSTAVKMKYLGDSSKDVMMSCYIGYTEDYRNFISSTLLHFYIPCTLEKFNVLNEGTYCIEIVSTLIGDITKANYCTNEYTFKVKKSANIPSLTIDRFSEVQIGCIMPGDTLTLLGKVENKMSIYQSYEYLGIGLANTEKVANDIPLQCEIEGQKSVGLYDKISCIIPSSIDNGYYSIFYSSSLSGSDQCPANFINQFNSLNFNGNIKKLSISRRNYINNIKATLIDINFDNSSSNPIIFNLTFFLNGIMDTNGLSLDNFNNKDVDIKLCSQSGTVVNTKCTFVKNSNLGSRFYLICTPESFQKNTPYSLVFLQDIVLGQDTNQILCDYENTPIYKKIIIPSAEYDFLIIFDENNSPNFDCNFNKNGFIHSETTKVNNKCGWCDEKCVLCEGACSKCIEGYSLSSSKKCVIIKDTINFERFGPVSDYYPLRQSSCNSETNNNKLFSFKIYYNVWKGENIAIESKIYTNIIFAKNQKGHSYGLNCTVEVNPDYYSFREQNYGYCQESFCTLSSFVNCSFYGNNIANGIYDIQIDSNIDFAKLVKRAKEEFSPIKIRYISKVLEVDNPLTDKIKITFQGELPYNQLIYLCPEIDSLPKECYLLNKINILYNQDDDETKIECSKEIQRYDKGCQSFSHIMLENNCGLYIKEDITYTHCLDDSSYLNLGMTYLLLIFIIIFN